MEKSRLYWLFVYPVLGCILAVTVYARAPSYPPRPLWLDEVTRVAIVERSSSYGEFIENIGKDPSFVQFSEWGLGRVGLFLFGKTELAFRLWPLVFGVLGVAGTYALVARISTTTAGLFAAFLIATGAGFVYHAREFKPYALDLALTMWTLYATVRVPDERSKTQSLLFTGLLMLFALSSLVFCFVFPAVMLYRFRHRLPRTRDDFLLLTMPALCFVLIYFSFLRPQRPVERFHNAFGPVWVSDLENLVPLAYSGLRFIGEYFPFGGAIGTICYLLLLPLVSYCQRDGVWILLGIPFIANVGASLFDLYPLFTRPSYYLCGLIVVAFAYLCGVLVRIVARDQGTKEVVVGGGLFAVIIGALIATGTLKENLAKSMAWPVDQGRKTLSALAVQFQPGDFLEINYATARMFRFYKEILLSTNGALMAIESTPILVDRTPADLCHSFRQYGAEIPIGARVWFLTSHVGNAYKFYEQIFSALGPVQVVVGEAKQGLILLRVTQPPSSLTCAPQEKK